MTQKELFGLRIKSLRETIGLTQENLAERMDITPNYLSSIERGKENPTFNMLIKFSNALRIEMWELFDYGHEVTSKKLREYLDRFSKKIDEKKLRLAVKILKAIER
jgi:transcriptional regulator with XRE-family HTH domain